MPSLSRASHDCSGPSGESALLALNHARLHGQARLWSLAPRSGIVRLWPRPTWTSCARSITAAKEFAGDRVVDVAAGQIGGQALKLWLIDQVVVNVVPVVFGSGRPFFATGGPAEPLRLENPSTIVRGDRVTHLVHDVSR